MPLQPQPFALQFAGGLETKQDPKQVPPVRLLDLQNATFIKQTTLAKRNGYRALASVVEGTLASVTNPRGLATRGGELIEFANGHAYSQIETGRWSDTGGVSSVVASSQPIARTGTAQSLPETATNGGITVAAWEDSRGGVWVSTIDATGREILAATQLAASGTRPRCVPVGNNIAILYVVAASGQIWCAIVNPVTPSVVLAPALLAEDLSAANPSYDAEPTLYGYSTDKPAIIAWATALGVRVGYIHPSGVIGGPLNGLPGVGTFSSALATGPVAVCWYLANPTPASPKACILWGTSSGAKYWFVNGTNLADISGNFGTASAIIAPSLVQRIAAAFDGSGVVWCGVEVNGSGDATTNFTQTASVTQAGVATSGGTIRGHGLVSRAFYDAGDVYAAIVHPAFYFSYVAVVRLSAAAGPASPTAVRIMCGQSPGLPSRNMIASVSALGLGPTDFASRQHAIPLLYRIQLGADPTKNAASGNYGEVGIRLVSLDFDNAAAWQTAQLGRGLYLASACIQHYDGARWAEADFHCAPDTATGGITVVQGAAGLIGVGTYNYLACYEEIDAQGECHQGPTCVPFTVTLADLHKATVTVPTYRLTSKRRVRIGIYRSPVGQTGAPDQIPYYRVSSLDVTAVGDNGYVANDVTVDTITFTDNMTDAVLLTREPLYTNGGIRSNDPVESAGGAIVAGKNRLFWLDPHDSNVVRFSQELRDDTTAELVASFSSRLDPYGGDVVGLAVMDGGLFAFKDTAVYVIDGPGPLANPDAGTDAFSPAQLVTSDVGCKAPRSIAQTPIGIAFQSDKGIKLMGRDRQVGDLGSAVYAYNAQTVSRATLLPDRHQIVFLTASGSTLLYDYERSQWSRFTNHEGLDAVVWNGTYCYLRNDGRVFAETPGVYKDDNSHIPMVIETAWIKFSGQLQNWQKVLRAAVIGEYKSSHQLQIRFRLDYEPAYYSLAPINVDANYTPSLYGAGAYGAGAYGGDVTASTRYQESVHINRRCQSISFQFSDIESTSTFGAAFELSELLLTGGTIGNRFPMGASRSQ